MQRLLVTGSIICTLIMGSSTTQAQLSGGATSCKQLATDIVTALQQNSFDKFCATTPYVNYKQYKTWLLKTMSEGNPLTAKEQRWLNDTSVTNAEAREIRGLVYDAWDKLRKYGDTTSINWASLTVEKMLLHIKMTEAMYKTYYGYLLMKDTVSNKTYTIRMKEIGAVKGTYYLLEDMAFIDGNSVYADELKDYKEACK